MEVAGIEPAFPASLSRAFLSPPLHKYYTPGGEYCQAFFVSPDYIVTCKKWVENPEFLLTKLRSACIYKQQLVNSPVGQKKINLVIVKTYDKA